MMYTYCSVWLNVIKSIYVCNMFNKLYETFDKRHSNATYYSFLKVYTLLYRKTDLSSTLNRVPRKYDFKLGKYTKSIGVSSVLYGWWIARWNPNTSLSSSVFLVVWHGALSWYNTTFSGWAASSGRNACMRSRRTVYNKTTHHFIYVKDKFNKSFETFKRSFTLTYSSQM